MGCPAPSTEKSTSVPKGNPARLQCVRMESKSEPSKGTGTVKAAGKREGSSAEKVSRRQKQRKGSLRSAMRTDLHCP